MNLDKEGGWDSTYPPANKMLLSCQMEREFEWRKWLIEIPPLKFKSEWEVQIIPPFSGAVVRFKVRLGTAEVSVYLDCYDVIGFVGQPYWEIYPYEDDIKRVFLKDTDELLAAIDRSLNKQQSSKSIEEIP